MSIVDGNKSVPQFYCPSPSTPPNKVGWAFTVNCSVIIMIIIIICYFIYTLSNCKLSTKVLDVSSLQTSPQPPHSTSQVHMLHLFILFHLRIHTNTISTAHSSWVNPRGAPGNPGSAHAPHNLHLLSITVRSIYPYQAQFLDIIPTTSTQVFSGPLILLLFQMAWMAKSPQPVHKMNLFETSMGYYQKISTIKTAFTRTETAGWNISWKYLLILNFNSEPSYRNLLSTRAQDYRIHLQRTPKLSFFSNSLNKKIFTNLPRPSFECGYREQSEHALADIVEVEVVVFPNPLFKEWPVDIASFVNHVLTSADKILNFFTEIWK